MCDQYDRIDGLMTVFFPFYRLMLEYFRWRMETSHPHFYQISTTHCLYIYPQFGITRWHLDICSAILRNILPIWQPFHGCRVTSGILQVGTRIVVCTTVLIYVVDRYWHTRTLNSTVVKVVYHSPQAPTSKCSMNPALLVARTRSTTVPHTPSASTPVLLCVMYE